MDFFGTPWDELTLHDLRAFFASAGDEGLDWETKGTELPHPGTLRKGVCGLANQVGGFFIIGARREAAGTWIADGVDFSVGEPAVWVSDVLRNGDDRLRPEPHFDVKAFDVEDERKVVLVMVEAIDQPPCMTGGRVAVRRPGQTVWIMDPAEITALLQGGQGVLGEAEAIAVRATHTMIDETAPDAPFLRFVFALTPSRKPDDLAARIFPRSFVDAVEQAVIDLPREPLFYEFHPTKFRDLRTEPSRSAVTVRDGHGRQRWTVRVAWDGSVATRLDAQAAADHERRVLGEVFAGMVVRRAVPVAEALVARFGGSGRAHAAMAVGGDSFEVHVNGFPFVTFPVPAMRVERDAPIQTWTDRDGRLPDNRIERMVREFLRDCGVPLVDPDPTD